MLNNIKATFEAFQHWCKHVVLADMSIDDIRNYESQMHSETNMIVRTTTTSGPTSSAAAAADSTNVTAVDEESPSTPSNTPTEKSAPFQFPDVEKPTM